MVPNATTGVGGEQMHDVGPDRCKNPLDVMGRIAKHACIWIAVALAGTAAASIVLLGDVDKGPELAPPFTLRNLDGDDVSLGEYRGSAVILDFWATWCKPCRETFPELHALQQAYEDQGVVLLVVSLDRSAQRAREYLIENEFATDNVLWGSLEEARAVKDSYGVVGITHAFLIDRAGYIRYSGHPTRLTPEELERWL